MLRPSLEYWWIRAIASYATTNLQTSSHSQLNPGNIGLLIQASLARSSKWTSHAGVYKAVTRSSYLKGALYVNDIVNADIMSCCQIYWESLWESKCHRISPAYTWDIAKARRRQGCIRRLTLDVLPNTLPSTNFIYFGVCLCQRCAGHHSMRAMSSEFGNSCMVASICPNWWDLQPTIEPCLRTF